MAQTRGRCQAGRGLLTWPQHRAQSPGETHSCLRLPYFGGGVGGGLPQSCQAPCRTSSPAPAASAWSPRSLPLPALPFGGQALLSRELLHLLLAQSQGQGPAWQLGGVRGAGRGGFGR